MIEIKSFVFLLLPRFYGKIMLPLSGRPFVSRRSLPLLLLLRASPAGLRAGRLRSRTLQYFAGFPLPPDIFASFRNLLQPEEKKMSMAVESEKVEKEEIVLEATPKTIGVHAWPRDPPWEANISTLPSRFRASSVPLRL